MIEVVRSKLLIHLQLMMHCLMHLCVTFERARGGCIVQLSIKTCLRAAGGSWASPRGQRLTALDGWIDSMNVCMYGWMVVKWHDRLSGGLTHVEMEMSACRGMWSNITQISCIRKCVSVNRHLHLFKLNNLLTLTECVHIVFAEIILICWAASTLIMILLTTTRLCLCWKLWCISK